MSTRTKPPVSEPCASCRAPVQITRWTERSRFTGGVWCDRCVRPIESRFADSARWQAYGSSRRTTRFPFLEQIGEIAEAAQEARRLLGYTGAELTARLDAPSSARSTGLTAAELRADKDRSRRCDGCGAMFPDRDLDDDLNCEKCRDPGGRSYAGLGETRVAFFDPLYDEPVYDREPDGVLVEGRSYAQPWWRRDGGASIDRAFNRDFDFETRMVS